MPIKIDLDFLNKVVVRVDFIWIFRLAVLVLLQIWLEVEAEAHNEVGVE
jgi:hypothetical protein